MNKNELEALRDTDITALDLPQLVDISEVEIDTDAPDIDRLDSFIKQINNPYCYKVGNTPVKVRFKSDKPHIKKVIEDYFVKNK